MNIMTKDRKVYMCTLSSNYSPSSIQVFWIVKALPHLFYIHIARCVRIFFLLYNTRRRTNFLSGRVKLIVTSEPLNIYKKMLPPIESQVIFLSKETPIVSVGLRTAEVPYTNQNKTA